MNPKAIILAAGKGTRMKSNLPKPLHKIAGRAMIDFSLQHFQNNIVIASEELLELREDLRPHSVIQKEQLGTGHAVQCAESHVNDSDLVYILYADTPFVPHAILDQMRLSINEFDAVFLGFNTNNLENKYGRIIMHEQSIDKIVEYQDASQDIKNIPLCNSGIVCAKGEKLKYALSKITNNNASSEYYLTDIVNHIKCTMIYCQEEDVLGVNSRVDLANAEKLYQNTLAQKHMQNGATLLKPETVYFSYDTQIASDVIIEENVHFGLGVNIASGTTIKAMSYLENCTINENCTIGPFARIRPGTILENGVHIGNFVEIKKSHLAHGVKANHLSYIGDATIGAKTNIGAGTIFCNYDGFQKHHSQIGDNVFIGSNACIISPINIDDNAIIAAGSVIAQNVEENAISISRPEQKILKNAAIRYRSSKDNKK